MLHTTLMTFITSLKEEISHVVKKCWSSSDNSSICRFVTKQFLRDHATYHRNKLCQYGNMLRSSDKLHVYLVLMILVFGYYETIILKTRNLWSEYKCIWPKNISSIRDNITVLESNECIILFVDNTECMHMKKQTLYL